VNKEGCSVKLVSGDFPHRYVSSTSKSRGQVVRKCKKVLPTGREPFKCVGSTMLITGMWKRSRIGDWTGIRKDRSGGERKLKIMV